MLYKSHPHVKSVGIWKIFQGKKKLLKVHATTNGSW
jgi:hypothetical protein